MKTILKTNIMKSRHYDVKEITLVGRQGGNLTIELEAYNDAYKLEEITLDITIYEFISWFGKEDIELLKEKLIEVIKTK